MLSSGQRTQFLREMGYQPLRLRGTSAPSVEAATRAPAARRPETPSASGNTQPARARKTGAAAHGDPLWPALLAAAGAPGSSLDELGWEERLSGPAFDFDGPILRINPIALRQQPAAKRALWKTLRSLRARHAHGP